MKVMHMCTLSGKPLRVNRSLGGPGDKGGAVDVGANLFIGNLDANVDEKLLYDTFSAFGRVLGMPKVMRDEDTGKHKGFGFVSYDNFASSDAAINAMHNQFLSGRSVQVQYAFKKDGSGERHGSDAERLIAASNPAVQAAASAAAASVAAALASVIAFDFSKASFMATANSNKKASNLPMRKPFLI